MTVDATSKTTRPSEGPPRGRADPVRTEPDASALDRVRLRSRAINAIELLWGPEARRGNLLEPDAYARLRRLRGLGQRSLDEIQAAVVAWGFDGVGGRLGFNGGERRAMTRRKGLSAALRELGAKQLLLVLGQLCEERAASCRQKMARRSSGYGRARRVRLERDLVYHGLCADFFGRCAAAAPDR